MGCERLATATHLKVHARPSGLCLVLGDLRPLPAQHPAASCLASTWVRVGDWKLIRFFSLNDDLTDVLDLYNLKNDLSETKTSPLKIRPK